MTYKSNFTSHFLFAVLGTERLYDENGADIITLLPKEDPECKFKITPPIQVYEKNPQEKIRNKILTLDMNYDAHYLKRIGLQVASKKLEKLDTYHRGILVQVNVFPYDEALPKGWKELQTIPMGHKLKLDVVHKEYRFTGTGVYAEEPWKPYVEDYGMID